MKSKRNPARQQTAAGHRNRHQHIAKADAELGLGGFPMNTFLQALLLALVLMTTGCVSPRSEEAKAEKRSLAVEDKFFDWGQGRAIRAGIAISASIRPSLPPQRSQVVKPLWAFHV